MSKMKFRTVSGGTENILQSSRRELAEDRVWLLLAAVPKEALWAFVNSSSAKVALGLFCFNNPFSGM